MRQIINKLEREYYYQRSKIAMQKNSSEEGSSLEHGPVKINVDLNFQTSKASINGKVIDYEKQMLLNNGLHIKSTEGIPNMPEEFKNNLFIGITDELKKFDRNYIMNKFCLELSAAIDRSTNTVYNIISKSKVSGNCGKNSQTTRFVTFQHCIIYFKKIPRKIKYFTLVMKKLPIHKIQILLEDNQIFCEIIDLLLDIFNKKGKKSECGSSSFLASFKSDSSKDEMLNPEKCGINEGGEGQGQGGEGRRELDLNSTERKDRVDRSDEKWEDKDFMNENLKELMKKNVCSYERINLLILLMPYDPALGNFFFQLNKKIIPHLIPPKLIKLFSDESLNCDKKSGWKKKQQQKMIEKIQKLILSIKTVLHSINSSKNSFTIIKNSLLIEDISLWIKENFKLITSSTRIRVVFLSFCARVCEIKPEMVNSFYSEEETLFGIIIEEEVSRNTRILKRGENCEECFGAERELDQILGIAEKIGCEFLVSRKNISQKICETILEYSSYTLNSRAIQTITKIIESNLYLRESLSPYIIDCFKQIFKYLDQQEKKLALENINTTMSNNNPQKKRHKKQKIRMIEMMRCSEIVLRSPTESRVTYGSILITIVEERYRHDFSDIFRSGLEKLKKVCENGRNRLVKKDAAVEKNQVVGDLEEEEKE